MNDYFEPLCKNCRHYGEKDMCRRKRQLRRSLIHGNIEIGGDFKSCTVERLNGFWGARFLGRCGAEGRFFRHPEKK